MIAQTPRLVTLLRLWDRLPVAPPPALRSRGRPKDYSDGLFVKALVVMIVRRLTKVHELLSVLEEPTREMRRLKALLHEQGRFPSRRTWDRRLNQVPDTLPEQIALVGHPSVGSAATVDGTGAGGRHRLDPVARQRRYVA